MHLFEKVEKDEGASRHLVREAVRAMWEQGLAEEDILDVLRRIGVPTETATFILEEVMEKVETAGIEDRRSIFRKEMEELLWEWIRDQETRTRNDLATLEKRLFALEKELHSLRQAVEKTHLKLGGAQE